MGIQRGSQYRETVEEANVQVIYGPTEGKEIIIQDKCTSRFELWIENDDYAGSVLEYMGKGYEFCSSYNFPIDRKHNPKEGEN